MRLLLESFHIFYHLFCGTKCGVGVLKLFNHFCSYTYYVCVWVSCKLSCWNLCWKNSPPGKWLKTSGLACWRLSCDIFTNMKVMQTQREFLYAPFPGKKHILKGKCRIHSHTSEEFLSFSATPHTHPYSALKLDFYYRGCK